MISRFFIDRPIFANVIAIMTILFGVVALNRLPVERYPQITPPTVQVSTTYPGANAQVVADTVAAPIEQQVNGVENMMYMSSTSSADGSYSLTVTFEIGTNLDQAQVQVQNRTAIAEPQLPEDVRRQGLTIKKQSTNIVLAVSLTSQSGTYDSLFLSNYATLRLRDDLSRVEGVGDVVVRGAGDYSMRLWLDPEKLQSRGLTTQDVIAALVEQNVQVAAGQTGSPPQPTGQQFQYTVTTLGRLSTPQQFEAIVLKTGEAGKVTYLRDVGKVELGAQNYDSFSLRDGYAAANVLIYQLPGSNALDVATKVRRAMEKLGKSFPPGMEYTIPFDTTKFVDAAIHEVYRTLLEAGVLVLVVILVFLQDWRALLVPATTVPVTIIGAFAFMPFLGFSINLLTLFGLVLAIGIVVDDAIVIVENAAHHIERGQRPREATISAMREVTGPVMAITVVLMAVFLPTAFLGGITGQLYRQFALTIAATALISAVNALTLKPAQCATWLRPPEARAQRRGLLPAWVVAVMAAALGFYLYGWRLGSVAPAAWPRWAGLAAVLAGLAVAGFALAWPVNFVLGSFLRFVFNPGYALAERVYAWCIRGLTRVSALVLLAFGGLVALTAWWYFTLPTGFLPGEDQGYVIISVQLPDAASQSRTREVVERIHKVFDQTPGIQNWFALGGFSLLDGTNTSNAATCFIVWKDWGLRTAPGMDQDSLVNGLRKEFGDIQEAIVFVVTPPAIQGLGVAGGFQMQVEDREGVGPAALQENIQEILAEARKRPELGPATSSYRAGVPQIYADIDRVKVKALDVPLAAVFNTLQANLGSAYINDFNKFGRTYQVRLQAQSRFRNRPEDIRKLQVRNRSGQMVPLGTLAKVERRLGPPVVIRYNLYPAAAINGAAAKGVSSGEALAVMEEIAGQKLPTTMGYDWTAMAFQEKRVTGEAVVIFGLAVLLVYLVLSAQYESWFLPMAVILVVPLGLLGIVAAVWLRGLDNNVYTQIGSVLIIALASKNAILIVEFARELRITGRSIREAAVEAARMRFRPILMTSFAFILGVLPLVWATGAGAASRQSLGTAVFGGMVTATVLAVFFVPVFFVVIQWLAEKWSGPPKLHPGETVPLAEDGAVDGQANGHPPAAVPVVADGHGVAS
jgi:HAE1 family hydrophobic/amphiphilic exporter-1